MWSMGVLIHLLLSGRLPFTGTNKQEVFEKISRGKVDLNKANSNWANVSQEAKDLIMNLLDTNPNTRWTAQRALSCSWLKQSEPCINGINKSECKVVFSLAA